MDLVGAKRVRIQPAGSDEIFVIEGKESKGGVISAEIEGLSKEPSRVFASNVAYYVSGKGTGETSVTFTLLDIPGKVEDEILGYKTDESGISFVGEDTDAPYCAVTLESEDLSGEKAVLAFFKGKFSRDAVSAETTTNEAPEPEGSEYTFTPISDDRDGKSEGQVMAKYVGNEEETFKELEDLVFDTTDDGGSGE
ncbi:MAG: phage tail protein [Alkalibacterium sp.]|uniref:major tail protein n=1 Tax=Tetragenococcus halophilus TaxID=51669 RepID=UPI00209B201B|nr:major tail protein [Tetragenococcus halophilus]MCO8294907.1 phage tail protein [Tetragenococcus halophilus]MDN6193955.1 phage tail protein [Alkalibacterium sp.]MDN6268501.1 phage tail protein [Tetragenococcus koreensis]